MNSSLDVPNRMRQQEENSLNSYYCRPLEPQTICSHRVVTVKVGGVDQANADDIRIKVSSFGEVKSGDSSYFAN